MENPLTLLEIIDTLKTIENYCTTPHWTASRRWFIESAARKLRQRAEKERATDKLIP